MLRDYIVPKLGHLAVTEVSRKDVAALHHGLREKPYVANRVLAPTSKMLNLAEKWELRPDGSNPCRHVEPFKEHKRERYLSSVELERFMQALSEAEEEGTESIHALAAIRLLLLTGCRLREILHLRWASSDNGCPCRRAGDRRGGRSRSHRRYGRPGSAGGIAS